MLQRRLLALAAWILGTLTGCSGIVELGPARDGGPSSLEAGSAEGGGDPVTPPFPSGPTGSIQASVQLPSGILVTSGAYTLTGPNGFAASSMTGVAASPGIEFLIGAVPAGSGYTITISETSADGSVLCSAAGSFDVAADETANVNLTALCNGVAPSEPVPPVPASQTGTIAASLVVPSDISINYVSFVLAGPDGLDVTDGISVSDSNPIDLVIHDVPAGTDTITFTATSNSGGQSCSGAVSVDLAADQTSTVTIRLQCALPV